jgi:hypothetical protein
VTVLELLLKFVGKSLPNLIELLDRAAASNPELAPKVNEWKDALASATTSDKLAQLARVIVTELGEIAQGKIKPADNPSNAI